VKSVWITGCFGFIGDYLGRYLSQNEHNVYGLGRTSAPISEFWVGKSIKDNVSTQSLNSLLKISGKCPDVIYHCAGTGSVGRAQSDPHGDFISTVYCLSLLLEWVKNNSPQTRIIVTSSAAVYGAKYHEAIRESDTLSPLSAYGYNKVLVEALCDSYRNNFDLDIIITRLFSVYGEGLSKQLLWDSCVKISKLKNNNSLQLFGTGIEKRDWIHISDVSRTLLQLIYLSKNECNLLNIGTGMANTVDKLINTILLCWFKDTTPPTIIYNGEIREGDPSSLVSNNHLRSKIIESQDIDLNEGVSKFVSWFKGKNNIG